jgi:hypothetical protein
MLQHAATASVGVKRQYSEVIVWVGQPPVALDRQSF